MGGILIYQKDICGDSETLALFRQLVFASEPEQAGYLLETNQYRMVLIHLEPEEKDGWQVASLVRGMPGYSLTPIVFLAKDRRCERRAFYEYHCYDFLVKPIRQEEIIKIVYPFLAQLWIQEKEGQMRVKTEGVTRLIPICDILYIESINRSVLFHTRSGVLTVPYLTLKRCRMDYAGVFVQCHRSILVNRNYVEQVDYRKKEIELPGCRVEIGSRYESILHREFD